jgi:transcriptional regulator with XRE-family HTH domain
MQINLEISQRIKQAREQMGLTQDKLAELADMERVSVWRLEHGTGTNKRTLAAIATALQVRFDWLMTGEGESSLLSSEIKPSERAAALARTFDAAPPDKQETIWKILSAVMALNLAMILTSECLIMCIIRRRRRLYENLRKTRTNGNLRLPAVIA